VNSKLLALFPLLILTLACTASNPPAPPQDRPLRLADRNSWEEFVRVTQPYVDQSLKLYPEARARFLVGLPPEQSFFVVVRLQDQAGNHEQVFLLVTRIAAGVVTGTVANQSLVLSGIHTGQSLDVEESQVVDWCITHADGSEEGNLVGKFLDRLHVSWDQQPD
jgi:hypothetical protein